MDNIEQMLADLGHGSEMVIKRDEKNGNTFRGYILDGGLVRTTWIRVEAPHIELVIALLDEEALEWLLVQD